jgi:hypothetical protein
MTRRVTWLISKLAGAHEGEGPPATAGGPSCSPCWCSLKAHVRKIGKDVGALARIICVASLIDPGIRHLGLLYRRLNDPKHLGFGGNEGSIGSGRHRSGHVQSVRVTFHDLA